ncbi:MAG: hypothetical protein JRI84_10335 [Deltaproteobacteria bacterium]|nr:hypothetical protein [Deltaproteobacteria bacterium]
MSTSLLYHAYGLEEVKYNSTRYKKGTVMCHGEVTSSVECCPVCGSWKNFNYRSAQFGRPFWAHFITTIYKRK